MTKRQGWSEPKLVLDDLGAQGLEGGPSLGTDFFAAVKPEGKRVATPISLPAVGEPRLAGLERALEKRAEEASVGDEVSALARKSGALKPVRVAVPLEEPKAAPPKPSAKTAPLVAAVPVVAPVEEAKPQARVAPVVSPVVAPVIAPVVAPVVAKAAPVEAATEAPGAKGEFNTGVFQAVAVPAAKVEEPEPKAGVEEAEDDDLLEWVEEAEGEEAGSGSRWPALPRVSMRGAWDAVLRVLTTPLGGEGRGVDRQGPLVVAAILLCTGLVVGALLWQMRFRVEVVRLGYEMTQLTYERKDLLAERERLLVQRSYDMGIDELGAAARGAGLALPKAEQIYRVTPLKTAAQDIQKKGAVP